MTTAESGYNGWTNYETWNVALWIGADRKIYEAARDFSVRSLNHGSLYQRFIQQSGLRRTTGDGVSWTDENLDIAELDEYIKELGE